jgi:hypothetical protein
MGSSTVSDNTRELTDVELDSVGGGHHHHHHHHGSGSGGPVDIIFSHDIFNINVITATNGGTNNIGNVVAGIQGNFPFSFAGSFI